MKTLSDFQSYVVQQRLTNNVDMSLQNVIRRYMVHSQRATENMVREYVYRTIGQDYRSSTFNDYIHSTILKLVECDVIKEENDYYKVVL